MNIFELLCVSQFVFLKFFVEGFNGEPATPHSFPYMAYIYRNGDVKEYCGGVLISDEFVLTAAVCVHSFYVDVILGAHNINQLETEQRHFSIPERNVYRYSDNCTVCSEYDLALIKLPTKVNFTHAINKVELESPNTLANVPAVFLKWAQDSLVGDVYLHYVDSKIIGLEKCSREISIQCAVCVSRKDSGKIVDESVYFSKTDAGGPLVLYLKDVPVVLGIGIGGNILSLLKPSMFIRVSGYLNWINLIINQHSTPLVQQIDG